MSVLCCEHIWFYPVQLRLGWRSLDERRTDARLCMLYKIIHGLVAVSSPPYFQQPTRMPHYNHPLALRQIHTLVKFYNYSFFPLTVVQWNRLPSDVVLLPTPAQFSEAVRPLDNQLPQSQQSCFILILTLILLIVLTLSSTFHLTIALLHFSQ